MQKGRVEQRHGAWHLRYRDAEGKQRSHKLALYCPIKSVINGQYS